MEIPQKWEWMSGNSRLWEAPPTAGEWHALRRLFAWRQAHYSGSSFEGSFLGSPAALTRRKW